MDSNELVLAFFLFAAIAFLYSSVGHAGASGYLAIMALLSFPIPSIKPTSLILNIVVSCITSFKYIKEGCFDKKVFMAFAISSIPCAFLGGYLKLEPYWFKIGAGVFLVVSAVLLQVRAYLKPRDNINPVNWLVAILCGAVIGLLSGLLGIGGGIFLSPLIIMFGWTTVRNASGIAALFILCNSILALSGHYISLGQINYDMLYWVIAVVIGGTMGSFYGSKKFNNKVILFLLFLVLLSAGIKFIFVG